MANVSTVSDDQIEAAITQLEESGQVANKASVRRITGGSPNALNDRIQAIIDRRKSAVAPTPEAEKLFSQVWGQLLLVARGEESERDQALAEAQAEIARLSIALNAVEEEMEAVKAASVKAIADAEVAASAAVAQADARSAELEREFAVVSAERDLIASDKTKLADDLVIAQQDAATAKGMLIAFREINEKK